MSYTIKEALRFLHARNFLHMGKNITARTMRTLVENGRFKTLHKCEAGRCLMIKEKELEDAASSQKDGKK